MIIQPHASNLIKWKKCLQYNPIWKKSPVSKFYINLGFNIACLEEKGSWSLALHRLHRIISVFLFFFPFQKFPKIRVIMLPLSNMTESLKSYKGSSGSCMSLFSLCLLHVSKYNLKKTLLLTTFISKVYKRWIGRSFIENSWAFTVPCVAVYNK